MVHLGGKPVRARRASLNDASRKASALSEKIGRENRISPPTSLEEGVENASRDLQARASEVAEDVRLLEDLVAEVFEMKLE